MNLDVVGNWPVSGQHCIKPEGWPNLKLPDTCHHDNLRSKRLDVPSVGAFKIHDRKLWTNSDSTFFPREGGGPDVDPYSWYRRKWIEAIMIGLHVYQDVPDMEFSAAFVDFPKLCNLTMPVLMYGILDSHSTPSGLEEDEADSVCFPGPTPLSADQRAACRRYYQGFAIPNPDTWDLAMSPDQLMVYSQCVLKRSNSTESLADRRPVAFWRGTNSGASKGWPARAVASLTQAAAAGKADCIMQALLNKRIFMALMATHWPWMDVKLSHIYAIPYCDYQNSTGIQQELTAVIVGERIPTEEWARNLLLVDVDGWGPAYRTPALLMSMTPVVHVESIYRSWWSSHFRPHRHYAAVASDLRDLASVTHHLVRHSKTPEGLAHLEGLAHAAREQGIRVFNMLAQVDSVFAAAHAATRACGWEVTPPSEAEGWKQVVWPHEGGSFTWTTPAFRHKATKSIGQQIASTLIATG